MTFTFTVSAADWGRIAPELVVAGMALLIMLADLLLPSAGPDVDGNEPGLGRFLPLPALALLGLVGAFAATIILFVAGDQHSAFNGMIGSDAGSLYGYTIILSASILGVLLSPGFLWRMNIAHQGEYYALWLFATIGMMLLSAATSFLVVFLGLEMLSLALYILSGYLMRRRSSQEAGMKYFLLSSFASAFLLYGIALTYGATGSTTFSGIRGFLTGNSAFISTVTAPTIHPSTLLLIGMGLLTVGFAFKVSAIPFQAWTPDVYAGAPAPVTAFMSVGTKAAALIAFARVFDVVFLPVHASWEPVIWAITILTIIGGNVLALVQTNLKRLLAYSSIAHAGYLLIGIVAGGTIGIAAILFYLLCYTFLNLGAFGVSSVLETANPQANNLDEMRGLWYRQPVLAGLLAFFLFSLAGFPPMAGFAAKYYLFLVALQSGHPELLIIGVLASVLGMYYYLKVIATMFMQREAAVPTTPRVPARGGQSGRLAGPTIHGHGSKRLGGTGALTEASTKGGAAVAVKATTVNESRTVIATEKEVERWIIPWPTWLSLGLSALGVLAMGTILPFWLVNVAQYGAQIMSLLR